MRRRLFVLIAIAACDPPQRPPPAVVAVEYAYEPRAAALSSGEVRGRIGRSTAPAIGTSLGIVAVPRAPIGSGGGSAAYSRAYDGPLTLPTIWSVPGTPARAVVYGRDAAGGSSIDLVEIDAGRVVWRSPVCFGPIVGVTASTIVCADVKGTRAIAIANGILDWETTEPFLAMDDDRVVIAGVGQVSIRKADGGDELAHLMIPAPVHATTVIASCPEREVFASEDTKLVRIANDKVAWIAPIGVPQKLDACRGANVIATRFATDGSLELISLARDTGKLAGVVERVQGWWPARDGGERIEVATAIGVTSYDRALADPIATDLPALGELIASRGELRLVRATPLTAVVIDREGVRALIPFGEMSGALGETALVASSWQGSPSETVHRRSLPDEARRSIRVPARRPGTVVAAELRDLPEVGDLGGEGDFAAKGAADPVAAIALDPFDPTSLYALTGSTLAHADLAARTWTTSPCTDGAPIGIAVARDLVACATRAASITTVAGITPATTRWLWHATETIDAIAAGGDVVIAFDADVATILDARDGKPIGSIASSDGLAPRVVALQHGTETLLLSYERGSIIARAPLAGMTPIWSIAVDGAVASLAVSHDGILVALDDGDAYRIDPRGPTIAPIPGLGMRWEASADVVIGAASGGPIYGPRPPPSPPPRPVVYIPPVAAAPPIAGPFMPPPMSTPLPMPPIIGYAWQLALYELSGGVRVRNEYLLADAVASPARAPSAPIVITYGPEDRREILAVDPLRGDPVARARLPQNAVAFSTVVDGKPLVGAVVGAPLRIIVAPTR